MPRFSRFFRYLTLTLAVAQLALSGALVVADGAEAVASAKVLVSHVEGPASNCPPIHGDDCAICHFLTAGFGVPSGRAPAIPGAGSGHATIKIGATYVPARLLTAAVLPRAPPVILG